MRLKKLHLSYFMKGQFQCSIDNSFFKCDGLNRMFKSAPTGIDFEIYIITYTNGNTKRALLRSIVNFAQLDEDVYFSYEEVNYKITLINRTEMRLTDGVNEFAITRIAQYGL